MSDAEEKSRSLHRTIINLLRCRSMKKHLFVVLFLVQKIELQRQTSDSTETVRGHIVISLISRDRGNASPRNIEVSEFGTAVSADNSGELPEGYVSVGFVLLGRLLYF